MYLVQYVLDREREERGPGRETEKRHPWSITSALNFLQFLVPQTFSRCLLKLDPSLSHLRRLLLVDPPLDRGGHVGRGLLLLARVLVVDVLQQEVVGPTAPRAERVGVVPGGEARADRIFGSLEWSQSRLQ